MKLIVAITGASGVIVGIRFLEVANQMGIETHLILSRPAGQIIEIETPYAVDEVKSLASHCYDNSDLTAGIASGSYVAGNIDAMVICPCSMKTLASVAAGYAKNLIGRCADVCLKQEKKLLLVPRESPLSLIHLRNLVTAREAGATVIPPMLSFYHKPEKVEDMVDFVVGKILDSLGVEHNLYERWGD
ncbi:MAG: hypothetical protein A7316_02910 [Candidatus Altiarchaeales archaeon WOR_SM1_86-2]|nr:MAG: hypothetical protein A7316_02910 [Candidatus Altiarchaeales archaeon WOR_SM1_86-2]ODS40823.1 MAG: hypothetical protein A7315_07600 [Candidatus Altiarchaeales archaeon WOR_SM1_79]